MTTALGIAPDDDGNGVTPLTHRMCQMYQWASTGVCGGLEVSGNSSLYYTVSAGMAVTSRGDTDGYCLAYSEGGDVLTEAGDSSNPRYDVVWVKANDPTQGDTTNEVELGVTQGTPAASPSVPDIEAGAVAVDTLLVPAGMTLTSACTSTDDVDYAVPYGASLGVLAVAEQTTSGTVMSQSSWQSSTKVTFTVPTDRYVECVFDFRAELTIASGSSYSDAYSNGGCYYQLYIDGEATDDSNDKCFLCGQYLRQQLSELVFVSKGTHTAQFKTKPETSSNYVYYWRGIRNTYVYDRGVAQ